MNIFTHMNLSIRLKRIIERNYNIKINTLSFIIGNIKPDIYKKYVNIPHYKKESEKYIYKEIQNVLKESLCENEKCTCSFSERLGILTHYLSDFFCYAHSEHYTKGIMAHYLYEFKLSLYSI